ncbi:MAG TPA: DUF4097 family beta strand repeat-containing protein [Thermoanaerobaculaceae bacterium]|nr:DUF4097 family beta strand repeat-containing protein [Thermoanaerobaculaceae bacterium]
MKKTLFALLIVTLAFPALAQVRVDETRQVAADATVTVENISGSLQLTGWSRNEVQVSGTLGRGLEKVDVSQSGNRLDIRVIYPHDCHQCGGADLEIRVPAGCRLEVKAVSAEIEAGELSGEMRLESVSGTVTVSSSGPSLRAKSVSGDVVIRAAGPRVEANTVSGTLTATLPTLQEGDFESVSGDIRIEAEIAAKGRVEAQTVSGDVELRLPATVGAGFEIHTFSGDIHNSFGPEARRTSQYGPGRELEFSNGNGSAQVYVKTLSGGVRLVKR